MRDNLEIYPLLLEIRWPYNAVPMITISRPISISSRRKSPIISITVVEKIASSKASTTQVPAIISLTSAKLFSPFLSISILFSFN